MIPGTRPTTAASPPSGPSQPWRCNARFSDSAGDLCGREGRWQAAVMPRGFPPYRRGMSVDMAWAATHKPNLRCNFDFSKWGS